MYSLLSTLNDALTSNAFTRSPYGAAIGLSNSAYKFTVPLQEKFAPLIVSADGYANKAMDAAESRYPYPFKAKPEEVAQLVRERRKSAGKYVGDTTANAVNVANKTIDEKFKSPVVDMAKGIDQRLTPIVDRFEFVVTRFNNSKPMNIPDAKYQYQRAYALSIGFKDHLYVYSNEQLKQLREHNALVRTATETAQSITTLASSSLANAQQRVHALADTMLQDLQNLQRSTANLSASLAASVQSASANQQAAFNDLSNSFSCAVTDFREILAEPIPVNEKVTRVVTKVKKQVGPLLDEAARRAGEVIDAVRGRAESVKAKALNGRGGENGLHPDNNRRRRG